MPTSASGTPKRWRGVDLLAKIPPLALLVALGLGYTGLDLSRHGPAWRALRHHVFLPAHLVATVNGQPLTQSQLDLGLALRLASRGQTRVSISPDQLATAQDTVRQNLIRDERIRQAAASTPSEPPAAWIEREKQAFESGFAPGRLPPLLQEEGLSATAYRERFAQHLAQVHWLDEQSNLSPPAPAEAWFQAHSEQLRHPEAVRARHIFLSTVEDATPEREQLIRDIHGKLSRGEISWHLAAQVSEDERSKKVAGDLGYFSRERVPLDFAKPVFALAPGELSQPFRTSIGWHVVQVTRKLPARPAQWPEHRAEVELHLRNLAKRAALQAWNETAHSGQVKRR